MGDKELKVLRKFEGSTADADPKILEAIANLSSSSIKILIDIVKVKTTQDVGKILLPIANMLFSIFEQFGIDSYQINAVTGTITFVKTGSTMPKEVDP